MQNDPASPHVIPTTQVRKKSGAVWIVAGTLILILGSIWWVNHVNTADQAGGPGGGHRKFGFGPGGAAMPVLVSVAQTSDLRVYLPGLGTVVPSANITLRTQISGQLLSVNFKEGQMVKKGDLLALIDSRPYQNTLHQAEGQILQAKSQLKEAQLDLERYQSLAKQDSIAKQQVDAQLALVNQYTGLVQTDQAAIDSAKLNITYCHIVAPVDGRVGLRLVDAGNYVTPGDAGGIVVLTQVKPITVVFTLPEDYVPSVAARIRTGDSIEVEAYDRTQTRKLATGVLENIDNQVDTTTGTFKLRAIFTNEDEALFPNQFVNIRMLLNTESGGIVVPTSSIERSQTGSYVYVIGEDNTASVRAVTLGSSEGERVAILTGLKIGDRVVSDGADKLREGAQVIIQAAPDVPAPAAPWAGKRKRRKNADGSPATWSPSEKGAPKEGASSPKPTQQP
ncbi:MAG: MdtA/MuxA family multidrug efflux RND transporter periplasmic adaptor subunit [Verrucomicrobiota bacterium]|jgi:multidrug efflux system membrane fusion protein|nr:MAG: MdtA/MuxA family multidrug efflux RND transporter periplasmic adaptor subunit [Verrucomicrobiota bacterium]